ncbi:MAG: tetratricopeptide repeat protein [Isosphaeraceae bacterium]
MPDADRVACPRCAAPISSDDPAGLCQRCLLSDTQGGQSKDPSVPAPTREGALRKLTLASAVVAVVAILFLGGLWLGNRQAQERVDAIAHYNLGNALQARGKLEEAVAEYRTAIRLKPDYAEAHVNLGNVLDEQAKPEEAIPEYRTAIRLKPDHADAHTSLGTALDDQGKLEEAVAEFRTAIRLEPDDADAHYNLGIALRKQVKLEEAVAEFRTAIRLKPDDADARYGLGLALKAQGKLEEAVAEYLTAIRLNPGDAEAHFSLGNALHDQGKPEEAVAEYRTAIRLKPDFAGPHYNLGTALRAQGKLEEAVAELRTAIRLEPDFADAHNGLAWALVVPPKRPRQDYDEGLQHARKAVELAPNGANSYRTLTLAEYRSGHWTESLAAGERAMALRKDPHASDWFLRALAHWQRGDKDEARKWFHKAVDWTKEKDPKNVELRRFWAEAAELLGQPGPNASGQGPPASPAAEKPR